MRAIGSGRSFAGVLAAGAAAAAIATAPVETTQKVPAPQPLAIGASAPDFRLPGTDGKTYALDSFKPAKALAVVFTAVHCPTAEVYEERLKSLVDDYRAKGVAFAVIQPNNAKALRLDEMGYTDLGDSLEDMTIRAEYRKFNFPFPYDGETQEISRRYGPAAFPDLMNTWRMYRKRPFQLVTVTVNYPDEEKAVRAFLEGQRASARNLIPAIMDPSSVVQAFAPNWQGGVPYSMVIAPDGKVLYEVNGRIDILKARRTILASFPDDDYVGQNAYWNSK